MRILHVDDYFLPALGYEAELARTQLEMGHDVYFAASKRLPREKGLSEKERGVSPVPHDLLWAVTAGARILFMPGIVRVLLKRRPQVVHCHGLFDFTSLALALLKPVFRYRLVYCSHTSFLNTRVTASRRIRLAYQTFRAVAAPVMRCAADRFTAVSEADRAMVAWGMRIPEESVEIVRLGADTHALAPSAEARANARTSFGFGPGDVVVAHTGTMTARKGVETLIEAVREPALDRLHVRLLLVGGGEQQYLDSLKRQIAESGMARRVTFVDRFVPREELGAAYHAADIACWPGDISIASVEALSAGLPLIVRGNDAYREFLVSAGNGLLYDGTPGNLAGALEAMAGDPDRWLRMGEASRSFAVDEFDWRSVASRFLEIYKAA